MTPVGPRGRCSPPSAPRSTPARPLSSWHRTCGSGARVGRRRRLPGTLRPLLLFGDETDGPVLAEVLGRASLTEEFLDRWRVPGEPSSRTWEERFGETRYVPLAQEALKSVLGTAGIDAGDVTSLVVAGLHERACAAVAKKSGVAADRLVDRLTDTVGNPGAAQPLLLLASALESARPGAIVVLLSLADGVDALALRVTDAHRGAPALDHRGRAGRGGRAGVLRPLSRLARAAAGRAAAPA